ncbi:MAG TPA: hypothetical protein VIJ62_03730 [Rhizomicrobium sp.]
MKNEKLQVSKIDAARRQLDCAIELWFLDKDPVSIHTLAAAAYQIIHDINKKRGSPRELLYDTAMIKDEYRKKFVALMKRPVNFFKHADTDPDPNGMIEFAPDVALAFIVFSMSGLQSLGEHRTDMTNALFAWFCVHEPRYVKKDYLALFNKSIPSNQLVQFKKISKSDFLKAVLATIHLFPHLRAARATKPST